ncbi:MAG: hypothetical protein JWM80_1859 [Cyanobacteria bacterium RYN_339]|nr:hypothetical protein [Cyanobacteria bacterium RYN_339]
MPIAEDKALEILAELIKKPESKAEDIPRIWSEIMGVYNTQFAPPAEPPAKKRRRRPANPNIGWPAGVKREEYKAWKAGQEGKGVTENLNPQEYKRQRDLGIIPASSAPAPAAAAVKKAPAAAPAKKPAAKAGK